MVNSEDAPSHVPTSIRLERRMADRLDEMAKKLSKRTPGLSFNRTDVIRVAIEKGLRALDEELAPKGKR